jgi:thioredoxin 1
MATQITNENFDELVKNSEDLVMIDFWAKWCSPCRMLGSIVDEIANDYEGKASVVKVNIDENPDITSRFAIRSIPTVLFTKGGEVKDRSVGMVSKNVLTEKMNALL